MKRNLATDYYNRPLTSYIPNWRSNVRAGAEVGIEIEVEGGRLPTEPGTGWVIHADGSLRGHPEAAEYVFREPVNRTFVPQRLDTLRQAFETNQSVVHESYRTSVHVHLNARDMLIKQIYNQILLYITCEDIFATLAGSDRIGNLFCLRAKDAEFFLEILRSAMAEDNLGRLNTEHLRYSAVNPHALFVHGSLEFRSFRGTTDSALIQQWVNLLFAVRDAAIRYDNPIKIVQDLSGKGPEEFAAGIFTKDQIALFDHGWQDKLYSGIQLIQHCAYVHDWVETDTTTMPSGPKKKVLKGRGLDVAPPPLGIDMVNAFNAADRNDDQINRIRAFTNPAAEIATRWVEIDDDGNEDQDL